MFSSSLNQEWTQSMSSSWHEFAIIPRKHTIEGYQYQAMIWKPHNSETLEKLTCSEDSESVVLSTDEIFVSRVHQLLAVPPPLELLISWLQATQAALQGHIVLQLSAVGIFGYHWNQDRMSHSHGVDISESDVLSFQTKFLTLEDEHLKVVCHLSIVPWLAAVHCSILRISLALQQSALDLRRRDMHKSILHPRTSKWNLSPFHPHQALCAVSWRIQCHWCLEELYPSSTEPPALHPGCKSTSGDPRPWCILVGPQG